MNKIFLTGGRPVAIIFVAQSGAGKDTQVALLENFIHERSSKKVLTYNAGEHFRFQEKGNSYTSRIIATKNSRGELLSVNWAIMHWSKFLDKRFTGEEYLIFNGSPRTIEEAVIIEKALCLDYCLDVFVVHIVVDDDTAYERIQKRNASHGARNETSSESSIRSKLQWYHTMVVPMIEHMKSRPHFKVLTISGGPAIEEVHGSIVSELFK